MFKDKGQEHVEAAERNMREPQDDYITKKKHELFDELEPSQVKNNASYNLGGMARAGLMFFSVLGIIVLGLYLFDFFRGAL